jgi:hypothetical protein
VTASVNGDQVLQVLLGGLALLVAMLVAMLVAVLVAVQCCAECCGGQAQQTSHGKALPQHTSAGSRAQQAGLPCGAAQSAGANPSRPPDNSACRHMTWQDAASHSVAMWASTH